MCPGNVLNSVSSKDMITVGRVLSPHGLKGQLKVEVLSDFPQRFALGQSLWVDKLRKFMEISQANRLLSDKVVYGDTVIISFAGIQDRTQAELLSGSLLCVEASALAALPEGVYYHFQLKGLRVVNISGGGLIGVVSEVLPYAANDVYEIAREGKPPLLLPALKTVIKKVDVAEGFIEVDVSGYDL